MVISEYESLVNKIKTCVQCDLCKTRTNAVPGQGSLTSKIMFVGEAPGAREDEVGLPFVGAAGNVLSGMLELIGLSRQEVYIANIIKCRPPNNRDPSPHEIDQCWKYLDKQIDLINPDLIVTLGRHSFGNFFPGELISQARGTPRNWNGRTIFPVYHPAATLHNPRLKPILEEDFRKMKMLINNTQIESEKLTKENLSETQLTFDFDAHELHETKKDNGNKL
ncbi:MAG: DNA polymerase [Chloroflexota bacterium]|jgi:uracil-DNA glycosylase family 4|nr:MAG: DNA polymerase [Chloroflexota bacterium]|tara:strand:- start:9019 stop:9684 length:666 start_codon:yes stop_codon:yes gene_type:complete